MNDKFIAHNGMLSGWTDERVERLRRLWKDGLSASQIAAELGDISRCAVIGKIHRLKSADGKRKLPTEPERPASKPVSAPKHPLRQPPAVVAKPASVVPAKPVEAAMVISAKRRSILTLQPGECKWPLWGPETDHGDYCSAKAVDGRPYCLAHCRLAYRPAEPSKRRPKQKAA